MSEPLPEPTEPEVGAVYSFNEDFGTGTGLIPAGAQITVLGLYGPGTPGLGYCDCFQVLGEFQYFGSTRYMAMPVDDFLARTTKVGES